MTPRVLTLFDDFLNNITMYRLVLYSLIILLALAIAFSFFHFLPFNPLAIVLSSLVLTLTCLLANKIFANLFKAPANLESVYITALILALIITPANSIKDLFFLIIISVLAMSSKYILAINRQHLFNPAAFAVAFSHLLLNYTASWWVGNTFMFWPTLFLGLLVVKKIKRFSLILGFLLIYFVVISITGSLNYAILGSPIFFFCLIMLTEPQTTPPTQKLQVIYGSLVGFISAIPIQLGVYYASPEIALVIGNFFSYLLSPKAKFILRLKEKKKVAQDTYDFVFETKNQKVNYTPGQYMEWTLPHPNPDSRGVRRYFTLASSPTEPDLRIGVKFYPNSSSFKKKLNSLKKGTEIVTGQLAGDFTLLKSTTKKIVFMAGGIGITPFRSMVKCLLNMNQKREIILIYSNNTNADIVYSEIFNSAKSLGLRTIYLATDETGYVNESLLKKEVPELKNSIFYLSGPHSMVDAFKKILKNMGIGNHQIKTDYFPGYA